MANAAIFSALLLSVTATLLLTGSTACSDTPSMSAAEACRKATTGRFHQICIDVLGTSPEKREVATYVIAAARAALLTYEPIKEAAGKLVSDPSTLPYMKSAGQNCVDRCVKAEAAVTGVIHRLRGCLLVNIRGDCTAAAADIDDCATAVHLVGRDTEFYRQILFSRDRSVLTLRLATLL
uniref:Pectinesterase inhibitor domain-containing protein n=1 Tax=Leersia perrieri TaxID=77586 RepID=A0A0D9X4A2_9ORYZ